ncbi:hypothetical protein OG352_33740 [Streptomyces sp. NBC_01485]|uniref:hypothetical protein n=1 Tax=Streptomyces sp. NBC_01485 TaxID=2903884 RepID=UPI002E35B269|nr:hypothetical protein [Streptomyces sp. NBC_01485]
MNRIGRALRRLAVLAAGTALLGASCGAPSPDDASPGGSGRPGAADRGSPVLAFVRPKANEIVLADAAGRTWRGARLTAPADDVRWSPDASALAWIDAEYDSPNGRKLHVLDIATGRERATPCPCRGVGFLGDDVATVTTDGDALLLFPHDGAPRRAPLSAPQPDYAKVAAGGADGVTVVSPLPEMQVGRGQYQLVAVDRSGAVSPFRPAGAPTSFQEGQASPDGQSIVWNSYESGGACWNVADIRLASYDLKARQSPKRPADAAMAQSLLKERIAVNAFAWAGQGLTVTFGPLVGCQVVHPARFVSYYLRDGAWRFIGSGMLALGYGAEGRSARLLVPERPAAQKPDENPFPALGDLEFTDRQGGRLVIGTSVSFFSFTPAESARAAEPPATPQPAQSEVARTDDRGEPFPQPLRALAQRIRDAAKAGDVPLLRSLCAHCDEETLAALPTVEGRRALVRLLSSHPGRTENGVVFPGLAAHHCVDEPGQDVSCTSEQIQDIALLDVPVEDEDSYDGTVYAPELDDRLQLRLGSGGKALWVGRLTP